MSNRPILIEFTTEEGLTEVRLLSGRNMPELEQKSNEAMDNAMNTIYTMAQRIHSTITTIQDRLSHVEIEFGLKFDSEAGVLIAKSTTEAGINVKLSWDKEKS